jgi:multidrug efflux pump subunit AcrA (membrane-fusion protein)
VLTIIVGSCVSGPIQQLYCDYNMRVRQGQVCAKIDPRPYQTIVDQYKTNLAAAKAQLEKDRAHLAVARSSSRVVIFTSTSPNSNKEAPGVTEASLSCKILKSRPVIGDWSSAEFLTRVDPRQ